MMKRPPEMERDDRPKQVLLAAGVLAAVALGVSGLLLGWRHVPGLAGEYLGFVVGLMTTPVILETSFVVFGLVLVITLNHIRQRREGDEFVYLEQVDGPDVPADLPDQARWAIYQAAPEPGVEPPVLDRAEGAVAAGDFALAAELLAELPPEELATAPALRVRIDLARATGHENLALRLEQLAAR